MLYTVLRIEEPDFGCEGAPEDAPLTDRVTLRDAAGAMHTVFVADAALYAADINEGDTVTQDAAQNLHKCDG